MFGKRKDAASLSEEEIKTITGLIWCLKPSDLSTLVAAQKIDNKDTFNFGTSRGCSHGIFWSKLVSLGLAEEKPSGIDLSADYLKDAKPEYVQGLKNLTAFSPTPQGKEILFKLLGPALKTGWPPKGAIISPAAIQMLQKYAEEGTAQSQSKLAYLYDRGMGVEMNVESALKWYHAAAKQDDPTALNNLGLMYLARKGVQNDPNEALRYFKLAAEKGSSGAMDNLGEMYGKGIGVPRDLAEAFKWFLMAAEYGHGLAKCKVGDFYRNGLGGTPQNNAQAYIWYSLGIAAGASAQGPRDAVASKLTPEQIKEASVFVSNWKPKSISHTIH